MPNRPQEPAYHIFCDEAGDQALRTTASDFFLYSAVVIATRREPDLPRWVERINQRRRHWNGTALHFKALDERTKLWGTRFIGKLPLRCFVVISNKRNMIGYRNVRAERASDVRIYGDDGTSFTTLQRRKLMYPHFVLKVLLERATEWCRLRAKVDYGGPRPVAITIAQRGGFYLDKFKLYLTEKDRRNYEWKSGTLPHYLAWSVINPDLITSASANNVAGLQLADMVASSFYRAIDGRGRGFCDRRFAHNLSWRIARRGKGRQIAKWGVTGLPWDLWEADLSSDQEEVFRLFGYGDEKLVRPGLILPDDW